MFEDIFVLPKVFNLFYSGYHPTATLGLSNDIVLKGLKISIFISDSTHDDVEWDPKWTWEILIRVGGWKYSLFEWKVYSFLSWPAQPAMLTNSRINNMLEYRVGQLWQKHARNVKLGSYNGAWSTEHSGTTFLTISQILMARFLFTMITSHILYNLYLWLHGSSTNHLKDSMAIISCKLANSMTDHHLPWLMEQLLSCWVHLVSKIW